MLFNIFRKKKKVNRLHFIIDTSLSVLMVILLTIIISLYFYQPKIEPVTSLPPIEIEPEPEPEINNPLLINFNTNTWGVRKGAGVLIDFNYNNIGEEEIENINISFEILSNGFSLTNLETVLLANNLEIFGQNLVINNLKSGQEGEGSVKAYISLPKDPLLRQAYWQVNVSFEYLGLSFQDSFNLSDLRFLSDTEIKARAYYHSLRGDQLGIGPIPPIVGIPTSYWVFFDIENIGNNLEDFIITARLPEYAKLSDKKTLLAGSYSYNKDNKQLIWQVPLVNKLGGDYRAGFEIIITPNEGHVASVLNIIENLSYRFKDSLSHQEVTGFLSPLDTNLEADFINQGQGKVIE